MEELYDICMRVRIAQDELILAVCAGTCYTYVTLSWQG